MKKRILFVDDEKNVLQGIKRMLRGMHGSWEMSFAESGPEALDILSQGKMDVIVSDMRMPGMDGAALLTEVLNRFPDVIRIVLSGHSDIGMVVKSVLPAHQYLSKPCDPERLKSVVERSLKLKEIVSNESVKALISQVKSLPTVSELYHKVVEELKSEDVSLQKIGELISKDVAMSAKILKLVNSSFFGFCRHISSPGQAVTLLGVDVIKSLILSVHIFSVFDSNKVPDFSLEALWEHSIATAGIAKKIAEAENQDREVVEDSLIAGMLHDVGKLVLMTVFTEKYNEIIDKVRKEDRLVWEVEYEMLGTSHAEIGSYLMGLWGMPDQIVEAIAFHHAPYTPDMGFRTLTAVHVGNIIEHEQNIIHKEYARPQIYPNYLKTLGLSDRLPVWKAAALEIKKGEGEDD